MNHRVRLGGLTGVFAILLAAAIAFVTASPAYAQGSTGTILGTVKDPSGAVVPGAKITITNIQTNIPRTTTTNASGIYRVPALSPGNYEATVSKTGFKTTTRKGLVLQVAQQAVVNITLQVGTTQQTVTVTSAVPLVNTTSSTVGNTVTEQDLTQLPLNGRNYISLTLLQPGIAQSPLTSVGTIVALGMTGIMYTSNGATLRSNNYTLDGAIMENLMGVSTTSVTGSTLGLDGIKEYKVITNMFGAQYGLTEGSQTVMVSRSGTNHFHGDVFDYLRNSVFDASNPFSARDTANVNGCGTNKDRAFKCKRLPPFRRNNFGASIGGPIVKNKTFFYGTYEGVRQATGIPIATSTIPLPCFVDSTGTLQKKIPAAILNTNSHGTCVEGGPSVINVDPRVLPLAEVFPQPNVVGYPSFNYSFPFIQPGNEDYGQLRLDQTFSSKDSMFVRGTMDVGTLVNNHAYEPWKDHYSSNAFYVTASETHIFSATVLNTFNFSFSRTLTTATTGTTPSSYEYLLNPNNTSGDVSINPGSGVTAFSGNATPGPLGQDIFTTRDDMFWTKGKHSLQFGTLLNHYSTEMYLRFFLGGGATFANLGNFFNAIYSNLTAQVGTNLERKYRYNTLGFYVQDDYQIEPKLTLNLGLRYEFMTTITAPPGFSYSIHNTFTDTQGVPSPMFINPSLHSFGPRLGFAWDVFGNGKTSLRGGGGIFYDIGNIGNVIATNDTGQPPLSELHYINNASATPAIPFSTNPFPPLVPGNFSLKLNPRVVDYHLQQPSMAQWNLTLDQLLPWDVGLAVSYIGSRGWHQLRSITGNPTIPIGYDSRGLPYYCVADSTGACSSSKFPPKINPAFNTTMLTTSDGQTYYNSLQTTLTKRISQGLNFQVNYTWSHFLDNCIKTTLDPQQGYNQCQSPYQSWADRASSDFDVRQNFHLTLMYRLPNISSANFAAKIEHGWRVSTIVSAQTGLPFTPVLESNNSRSLQNNINASDRPDYAPNFNKSKVIVGKVSEWFDPTMYSLPPAGHLGNVGRSTLVGPGLFNADLSLQKDTRAPFLGESGDVMFRASFFNILNHPNYSLPNNQVWEGVKSGATVPSGQLGSGPSYLNVYSRAGQISSTVTNMREIQFALRFIF